MSPSKGWRASIASVIAMAGDTVTIAENAMMMIHNPYGWAQGDAEAMRKTANIMDKIADSIAVSYTARTGKSLEDMKALMESESWFTAKEALNMGLVDQIDEPVKAAARFDLSMFRNTPDGYGRIEQAKNLAEPVPPQNQMVGPQPQIDSVAIADLCRQAGYAEKTAAILKAALSEDEVKARLASYDQIKNRFTDLLHQELNYAFNIESSSILHPVMPTCRLLICSYKLKLSFNINPMPFAPA